MSRGNRFRITGGTHKGRQLQAPLNILTRPMQGYLREMLFNILGADLRSGSILDLFSGTGSIGIEALSRGAASCVFFEKGGPALRVLHQNIKAAGFEEKTRVIRKDLLRLSMFPESDWAPFDFIFLDPPFSFHDQETFRDLEPLITLLDQAGGIAEDATLTLQVRKKQSPPSALGRLHLFDERGHGSVALAFFR